MYVEEKLLTINPISRPNIKLSLVQKIVIHDVSNSGLSAIDARNFFESLNDQENVYISAHYVVGLKGEIIKMIPEDEVAYHSGKKDMNRKSIGIECSHLDGAGKLNSDTYESLIWLLSDIAIRHHLDPLKDIIRHYDITMKCCPKYFVDNPSAFEKLKKDVQIKMMQ